MLLGLIHPQYTEVPHETFSINQSCNLAAFSAQATVKPYYYGLGAGAVFPSADSSAKTDSYSVLYGPTSVGTSLFTLPNVDWKNTYETGFELSAVMGMKMFRQWRMEGEFLYQNVKRDISGDYGWREQSTTAPFVIVNDDVNNPITHTDSTANVYSLMANTYYDFKTGTPWIPFIGAGIGIAWMDSDSTTHAGTLRVELNQPPLDIEAPTQETSPSLYGTAFAWQVKAGLDYTFFNESMSLGLNYRLFGTTKFKASSSEIITNPDISNEAAVFQIPETDVDGLLNSSFNVAWKYRW